MPARASTHESSKTQRVAEFLRERVSLFKAFSPERLNELVGASQIRTFETNEVIVHQGASGSHLGVILSGAAGASIAADGGARLGLGRLREGETFGEMALMTARPAPAEVTAESHCEVLLVPVSIVQSVIVSEPAAVQEISRTITDRMQTALGDSARPGAAHRGSEDPYGLSLKGERRETILVVNCGSSSLKYCLYDTDNDDRHARGVIERIGLDGTRLKHQGPRSERSRDLPKASFGDAIKAVIAELTSREDGVIGAAGEVSIVAHRVVHGGERFTSGAIITDEIVSQIEALNPLAPLHNPAIVAGIRELRRVFAAAPHVAVFDSAFHHTLPPYAYLYGLPYELYETHKIRRYGFHGSSHSYVALRAAQFLGRRPNELRLVSCHLGNGASVCAVDHGRSVDTSMGFTPTEGLVMGTRCGDLDPGVIAFLQREEKLTLPQIEDLLDRKSGLLGLSGISSDMREVLKAAEEGNHRAILALKTYCYRVRKYIGAYVAAMGGLDAVAFTAGVGQGSAEVRALALQGLECMGISLDTARNRDARGSDDVCRISTESSTVPVLVVPTDEERMIAREAMRTISRSHLAAVLDTQRRAPFPVEVSAHHIHLTQEHVEALFGKGHRLTKHADLSQPGQFACREQLTVIGPRGRIERVRVLGPARSYTQVEVSMTEQYQLGIQPPLRESGDIADSPGCTLQSESASIIIDRGVICARRHIHMTPQDALRYGVRDKSVVRVRIEGDRELIFGDVLIRVDPSFALAMHIDTDEANAAGVRAGARGTIAGIQSDS